MGIIPKSPAFCIVLVIVLVIVIFLGVSRLLLSISCKVRTVLVHTN